MIRVEERMGDLAGGLFLGMGIPLTFAGLGFIIPVSLAALGLPWLIPIAFITWAGLVFTFARAIYRTVARQRDAQLHALADGLAELYALPPSS